MTSRMVTHAAFKIQVRPKVIEWPRQLSVASYACMVHGSEHSPSLFRAPTHASAAQRVLSSVPAGTMGISGTCMLSSSPSPSSNSACPPPLFASTSGGAQASISSSSSLDGNQGV
ncbi:hypothetical protein DACRYDRAFT_23109, partial [Dacryopinax primogenitus]